MKNRGRIRNTKAQAKAVQVIGDNPRLVESAVRPGFVVGRLVHDLGELIGEAQHGYVLANAVGRLHGRPDYETLREDLQAELASGELQVPEPAKKPWWRLW